MFALLAFLVCQPTGGARAIDLNAGWSFARIPTPQSVWNGPDAVPTSSWRVMKVSSQETASETADAAKAFDTNPTTFWHTEWSKRQAPYPHELVIDLGASTGAIGLRILPRQTGPQNGRPNHLQLFLSDVPDSWGQPILEGAVPDSGNLFEFKFAAAKGRYLRLLFLDGYRRDEPFLALSEIGLVRDTDLSKQKGWESQYGIASIQTGERRFDLFPSDLERMKRVELAKPLAWRPATLPHAAWIRPLNKPEIWQGVAYYRRPLTLTSEDLRRHIELTIDGAMQSSDLWLNGKLIASRRGGYLPLAVDLTGKLLRTNDLLVRVDNSDNPLIPPGKPQGQLDFMYGSGLTRSARLKLSDRVFITDPLGEEAQFGGGVYVTYPVVAAAKAQIRIRTHIRNSDARKRPFLLRQTLLDSEGRMVTAARISANLLPGKARWCSQDVWVANPRLWSPDAPSLYRLETELLENGQVLDEATTSIGIRRIEVSRKKGFVINGKPLRLVGTNRHQDYPWVGPALSDAANRRDAMLIKRSGHNIVRLSHYPQSPAFLDACDQLGILTIPCIPGWQFVNRDPRFEDRVRRDIRDLIRRDRNHPSVAFWEASLNETYPGHAMAQDWSDTAKSEGLEGSVLTAGDGTVGAPWDVVYNGWKEDLSRPQDAAPDRPGYIREYGDYEFGGAYSTSRVKMGQGMDKLLQEAWNHVWSYNRFRKQYPWTMGAGTWEMFDHNVPWEFSVSASGLSDIFRREKPSFWFFESQESKNPFLRIASTWQPGLAGRDVVVFTNCDKATLYINGRSFQTSMATKGKSTSYADARPFDGSNTENLAHPPIVFRNVPFIAGDLKVVGMRHRQMERAVDVVRTYGRPASLKVWVDDLGVPPGRNDIFFIRAAVVDAKGVVCADQARNISFSVLGAKLAGQGSVPAEMGVASVLIRTAGTSRQISVTASGPGIRTGKCLLRLR